MSIMRNTKKIVLSTILPVFTTPFVLNLNGQKGFMPLIVKLSANKWNEYPRKNGNA